MDVHGSVRSVLPSATKCRLRLWALRPMIQYTMSQAASTDERPTTRPRPG
jgi:hypothetical protein